MTVDAPLHVGLRQGGERHVQVNPQGKPSLSHFRALERRGGQSYCEVRIETGRTHQIRVHLASIGHPVAGDVVYGPRKPALGLERPFLHAWYLGFKLPDEEACLVAWAPLPEELQKVLGMVAGSQS
jgi:23S rRNA pseudouridine955/2504/2580 synthase